MFVKYFCFLFIFQFVGQLIGNLIFSYIYLVYIGSLSYFYMGQEVYFNLNFWKILKIFISLVLVGLNYNYYYCMYYKICYLEIMWSKYGIYVDFLDCGIVEGDKV